MIPLTVLLLCAQVAPEGAEAIMARVAKSQDRAQQVRTAFVFHQDVLVRINRNNGKLAREEYSEYTVTPSASGLKKDRTLFKGKLVDKGKVVEFNEPGWEHKSIDFDADLGKSLADDLTNDEKSRDGIARDLFPLRAEEQRKYGVPRNTGVPDFV